MKKPADIKDVWFILPDGTNIFDSEFRAGALSVARELALPKVRLSNETLLLKKFSIENSGKNSAMAVIAHVRKPALLKAFGKSGIPLVLLGEEAVEDWRKAFGGPITVCSVDNESIGQMAADYLHEQGRFASYIYADGSSDQFYQWWTSRRYESFVDTLREHGYTGEVLRVPVLNSSAHTDAEHFLKAMEKIPRPIAVFACNDRAAREIVSFCHLANLHIPDDVAVLGVDDEKDLCESCPVPLSSIKIEHYRLGRTAMHLILRMLEGGPRRDKVILCPPVRVIERASTKRSTPSDKFVASAVNFIRTARLDTLDVMAVVKACGASRSYLEKRFRAETGRTILDAIHRRTLEDVKHLLLDTDKSVAVIAQETGFPSASGLCSMFRRLTGQSTSEFRATRQPRRRPTKTPRADEDACRRGD